MEEKFLVYPFLLLVTKQDVRSNVIKFLDAKHLYG